MADTIISPLSAECPPEAQQFIHHDIIASSCTKIATPTPSNVTVLPHRRQQANGGNASDANTCGDGVGGAEIVENPSPPPPNNSKSVSIENCSNPEGCLSLLRILKSFNVPISEEQGWALIYQSVRLYRDVCREQYNCKGRLKDIRVPMSMDNLNLHKDGSVHVSFTRYGECDTMYIYAYIYYREGNTIRNNVM